MIEKKMHLLVLCTLILFQLHQSQQDPTSSCLDRTMEDAHCDQANNNAKCNWDEGDCDIQMAAELPRGEKNCYRMLNKKTCRQIATISDTTFLDVSAYNIKFNAMPGCVRYRGGSWYNGKYYAEATVRYNTYFKKYDYSRRNPSLVKDDDRCGEGGNTCLCKDKLWKDRCKWTENADGRSSGEVHIGKWMISDCIDKCIEKQKKDADYNGATYNPKTWDCYCEKRMTGTTKSSNYHTCYLPIDGGFGEWSDWGACSKTCGSAGLSKRTRNCDNPKPKYKGALCNGIAEQTRLCFPKMDCSYATVTSGKCKAQITEEHCKSIVENMVHTTWGGVQTRNDRPSGCFHELVLNSGLGRKRTAGYGVVSRIIFNKEKTNVDCNVVKMGGRYEPTIEVQSCYCKKREGVCPSFKTGDGTGGTELRVPGKVHGEDCARACEIRSRKNKAINGATVNGPGDCYCEIGMNGRSKSSVSFKTCFLNDGSYMGYMEPKACEKVDVNYVDQDISCSKKTESWLLCSEECRKDSRCTHWTYTTNTFANEESRKDCCLKKGKAENEIERNGVVSGTKDCGAKPFFLRATADFSQKNVNGIQVYNLPGILLANGNFIFKWINDDYWKMVLTTNDGNAIKDGYVLPNSDNWEDFSTWNTRQGSGFYSLSNFKISTKMEEKRDEAVEEFVANLVQDVIEVVKDEDTIF